mgnify:CR=1 FL=1
MSRKLLTVALPIVACMFWVNVQAQAMEEITVEASPIVKETKGDAASPAPGYYKVMMSSRVSYADLDLAKPADAATLESRINQAATDVCAGLGKAYPDSAPNTKECAKRATEKAMVDARKVIAKAGKK